MTEQKKDLVSPSELEKRITSPEVIDYLAGKVKEHDLGGIKLEVKQPNGPEIGLSVWDKGNKTEWKTLKNGIPTSQTKKPITSGNQENFSQEEKVEVLKTTESSLVNNSNGNSGSESSE